MGEVAVKVVSRVSEHLQDYMAAATNRVTAAVEEQEETAEPVEKGVQAVAAAADRASVS